ncbi:MAG: RNA-guided endonuclease InsQ/TnpB family protein, partial [Methylohalobius sp.]
LVYHDIRKRFGLSANLAIRAIARVAWAVKAAKRKNCAIKRFKPTSVDYDERIFAYRENEESVSLTTVNGRIHVPLVLGTYQRGALRGKKPTAAKLVYRNHAWFIHIVIEDEPGQRSNPICAIGVDRGVYNIAVTSTGTFHSGRQARHIREKFAFRRAKLQSKGTRSAKRALKRLSGRERRFMRNENHRISKAIVAEAVRNRASIKLENLTGIRDRIKRFSRAWNRKVNAWAFRELETMIRYKAALAGVEVVSIPAKDTSRECSQCGAVDPSSRSGAHFECAVCGYRLSADLNAAKTISGRHACPERAAVNRPMVAGEWHSCTPSYKPLTLVGGR